MKVINLWGPPGSGKSTVAAGLFYRMKMKDYNVELISEFAKDVTWEGHHNIFLDQIYIFSQQNRKLERLRGQVDFAINDSPLLMQLAYCPEGYYDKFAGLVKEVWDSYDNINILLQRTHEYRQAGRHHTESQAANIEREIRDILHFYDQEYHYINHGDPVDTIIESIIDDL